MTVFLITVMIIIAVFAVILNVPVLLNIQYESIDDKEDVIRIVLGYSFIKLTLYPKPKHAKIKKEKKKKVSFLKKESDKNEEVKNDKKDNNSKNKVGTSEKQKALAEILDMIRNFCDVYKYIKSDLKDICAYTSDKLIIFRKIGIYANFGFGSADETGLGYGVISGILYSFLGVIHHFFTINDWDIKLIPDFERKRSDISAECILKTKLSYIIVILWKIAKVYMKYQKINASDGKER